MANALSPISTAGTIDLSLATNDVNTFAAQATASGQSINYQDTSGFDVGQVTAGGLIPTVTGITANTTDGTVRLEAQNDITQSQSITADALSAISTAGTIDLSLATNDVNTFAAQATASGQSINYQDASGFDVGQVAAGGLIPTVTGISANTADGTVRLEALNDITQSQAITSNALSAISTAGTVDLSLPTNDVTTFAAQAT